MQLGFSIHNPWFDNKKLWKEDNYIQIKLDWIEFKFRYPD